MLNNNLSLLKRLLTKSNKNSARVHDLSCTLV